MYNKVILMGNLTRDVEIRYTQGGSAIGNTGIAVNRKWKSPTGEQKEETMFVDLTLFGRTAEIANQYLRKGSKVMVDGRLNLDTWSDKDGQKRSRHTVIVESLQMIGGKDDAGAGERTRDEYSQPSQPQYSTQANHGKSNNYEQHPKQKEPRNELPSYDIDEDEIPF